MRQSLDEPAVVERAHAFLRRRGVSRLFTDSHESLRGRGLLEPYQRFSVDLGDFVVHPDLVALESDGETLLAVEAKGSSRRDVVLGLAQAELYQSAFHRAYLAADSGAIGERLGAIARLKNIGLLAVGDDVQVVHEPTAHMPLREAYRFVARQLQTTQELEDFPSSSLNLPTHYLVWAIALQPGQTHSGKSLQTILGSYPIRDVSGALRGARRLGIVRYDAGLAELTDVGGAVKALLPQTVEAWATIHRAVATRDRMATLNAVCPSAGAVLRMLLLQNASVRLIVEGLRYSGGSANLVDLAANCDRLDHARATVLFLTSTSLTELQDERGAIDWMGVDVTSFRPTLSYQLKSVLKHAGILAPNVRLRGGARISPTQDNWQLA